MKRSDINKLNIVRRALAAAVCFILTFVLLAPAFAKDTYAAEAGGDLEIRVGYWGDDLDYRTKAVLSRQQLEEMSAGPYYYSNITRVGTVMETVAWGPTIIDILNAAGIDPGSVMVINFRTTDRMGEINNWFVSLDMDTWVNQERYYYPHLRESYERHEFDDGGGVSEEGGMMEGYIVPLPRSTRGVSVVPAILAVTSYATKDPNEIIDPSYMSDRESYRFCVGQSWLTAGEASSDYTSMNSAQYIFGIDVTLNGTPGEIRDVALDLDDENVVVGSTTVVRVNIDGDEFYEGMGFGSLIWESSDPSVADVDQDGVVTIYGEGTVTITVTASNGISRSVTLNCVPPGSGGEEGGGEIIPGPPDGGDDGGQDPQGPSDDGQDPQEPSDDGQEQDGGMQEEPEVPVDESSEEADIPDLSEGETPDPETQEGSPSDDKNEQEKQDEAQITPRPARSEQTASIDLSQSQGTTERGDGSGSEDPGSGESEDEDAKNNGEGQGTGSDAGASGTLKKGMRIYSRPHAEEAAKQDEYSIEVGATALDAQQRMKHAGLYSVMFLGLFAFTGGVGRFVRFRKETV